MSPFRRTVSLLARINRDILKTKKRVVQAKMRTPPITAVRTTFEWNDPGLIVVVGGEVAEAS